MTKDFWRVLFIALLCKSAVAAAAEPSMPQAFLAKLPDAVDGIPQLNSQGGVATYDLGANYKSGEDVISLYIFRATNPNAALWFERADSLTSFGSLRDWAKVSRLSLFRFQARSNLVASVARIG